MVVNTLNAVYLTVSLNFIFFKTIDIFLILGIYIVLHNTAACTVITKKALKNRAFCIMKVY
jgi:hypothetical protein